MNQTLSDIYDSQDITVFDYENQYGQIPWSQYASDLARLAVMEKWISPKRQNAAYHYFCDRAKADIANRF